MIKFVEGELWDELLEVTQQKNIPLFAMLELTYACNLNCVHCYIPDKSHNNDLTTYEIKNIIDDLTDAGCIFLTLTGGEVFKRDDIWEILEYVYFKKFAYQIFTNGTFITNEVVEKLKNIHPWEIGISLYSMNEDIHNKITGVSGSFKKTVQSILNLRENNIPVRIKTVLMEQNFDGYEEILKFADKFGIKVHFDFIISPKNDGDKSPLKYRLSEEKYKILICDTRIFPAENEAKESSKKDNILCHAGKNSCSISPSGDVYSCIQIPVKAGNIRESSFVDIWKNGKVLNKIRKITENEVILCNNCSVVSYCSRCPGQAYIEDGNINGPANIFCRIAKIRKEEEKINESKN